MRLFIREQRSLIFVYLLQLLVVFFVLWLDGYRHVPIFLYAALLSGSLLLAYLVFRYITNRSFYRQMEQEMDSISDFTAMSTNSPLSESLQRVLKRQYRLYISELTSRQEKVDHHLQFVNQWVHQMKTPLSVIHLMTQDEDDSRSIAIGDEVDRLRKGLDLVLYAARLDTFENDLYVEALQLDELVRAVLSNQKRLFIRNKIFPLIEAKGHVSIFSDEKWLSFAITQLITNAVKYTESENAKIYFRIHSSPSGDEVKLEIQDEGIGIPESDLPRVFDAYFTGENGRKSRESTGMGLYLVRGICQRLGHQVEITSKVGDGTKVTIVFQPTSNYNVRN